MSLADEHAVAAAELLVEFYGEAVTVRKKIGGATRAITAIVERMIPVPGPGASRGGLVPNLRLRVLNSVTTGYTPGEWEQGDEAFVAERLGGTARWIQMRLPRDPQQQHDAGLATFELR